MDEHEGHEEELVCEVGHAGHGDGFWESYTDLYTDPAHWAFEITGPMLVVDLLILGIGMRVGKWFIRRHDEKHHDHTCEDHE